MKFVLLITVLSWSLDLGLLSKYTSRGWDSNCCVKDKSGITVKTLLTLGFYIRCIWRWKRYVTKWLKSFIYGEGWLLGEQSIQDIVPLLCTFKFPFFLELRGWLMLRRHVIPTFLTNSRRCCWIIRFRLRKQCRHHSVTVWYGSHSSLVLLALICNCGLGWRVENEDMRSLSETITLVWTRIR